MEQKLAAQGDINAVMIHSIDKVVVGNVYENTIHIHPASTENNPFSSSSNQEGSTTTAANYSESKINHILESSIKITPEVINAIEADLAPVWRTLASELEIPSDRVEELQFANQMLEEWKDTVQEKATIGALAKALVNIEKNEIALKLNSFSQPSQPFLALPSNVVGPVQAALPYGQKLALMPN